MIAITEYNSPWGDLLLGVYENKLCLCDWKYRKMRNVIDKRIQTFFNTTYTNLHTELAQETINQLESYANKKITNFNIPLILAGSVFQIQVWETLQTISYGKTSSYKNLAKLILNEQAVRAVANANGANGISIIIPCHRVIGSQGELTGYAGGLTAKKKLLQLEAIHQSEIEFNF